MSKYSKIAPKDTEKLRTFLGDLYEYVNTGDRVLDFGCSTGYFGKLLIDNKKCIVDGIEIDESDFKKASRALGLMYSFDLDGDWPDKLYTNRYDVLFFGDILEHLKFPEQALKKAKPLLKEGGRILISTPNVAHISTRLELMLGEFDYEETGLLDNTHLKYFTLNSLKKLASEAGYKIVALDYSLVDFSPEAIKISLGKAGLEPNDKFWELVKSPEARAYQYKLVLRPAGPKSKQAFKVPRKPIKEHDYLGQTIIKLRKSNEELTKQIATLAHDSAELNYILNSKTWRTAQLLKKPYMYIRTRFL
jgi:2-polyprenyl-3-methyl-5-hydroxy-6-metoxy-1,4-benzoquinol methylase